MDVLCVWWHWKLKPERYERERECSLACATTRMLWSVQFRFPSLLSTDTHTHTQTNIPALLSLPLTLTHTHTHSHSDSDNSAGVWIDFVSFPETREDHNIRGFRLLLSQRFVCKAAKFLFIFRGFSSPPARSTPSHHLRRCCGDSLVRDCVLSFDLIILGFDSQSKHGSCWFKLCRYLVQWCSVRVSLDIGSIIVRWLIDYHFPSSSKTTPTKTMDQKRAQPSSQTKTGPKTNGNGGNPGGSASKRKKQDAKTGKGLRHFSMKVSAARAISIALVLIFVFFKGLREGSPERRNQLQ